jgi:transposase
MNNITLVAIDVAKNVFQLHGTNSEGRCMLKKRVNRENLMNVIAHLPPCTIVMEACASTYHWARQFQRYAHSVKLISPQYVKPFVKGNKTDVNDAQAIAEAARRPDMRFVPLKSIEQQDIQLLHRIRERLMQQRTAVSNQLRGLLAEYGIVTRKGVSALHRLLPQVLEDATNALSPRMRGYIHRLANELRRLEEEIDFYNQDIETLYKTHPIAQRLSKIPGVGPLIATAILAVGDLSGFKNGRHFAAFLGLVPREHSSGNCQRLLGISKRGNTYLRTLLIHGARSTTLYSARKTDKKSQWLQALQQRRGYNRACCALANKNARLIWAMVTSGLEYQPSRACA